uniref:Titin n=1 Tax=Pygocentrus nattereri TaxID=42514 RepID=A0AAR2LG40_PYGNA
MKASFTNVIETQFTITGLTEGAKYDFRVIAKNAVGTISKPSYNSGPIVALDEVEPPKFSIDPEYTQTLIVNAGDTFKIDADVHGKPVPTIQWFKGDKEIENTIRCEIKNTDTRTSFKVENLAEGAMYYFRVMAENEFGVGLPVETKTASKASEVPLPVGKVLLTDVTKASASLAWEKPEHDGGSRIVGYLIEMQPKGTDKWGVATSVKTCEGTVTGLTAGQEYLLRVLAYNEKGKSEPKLLAAPVIANDLTIEPSLKVQFSTYSVKSGDDLKLEIPVFGRPKPKVTWMKDGQTLKVTSRISTSNTPTSAILQITEANKDDLGKYAITATNSAGAVTEEIGIIILDNVSVDPKYKDVIVINAGENLVLEADIHGKPIPDVQWLKEGKEMDKTLRIEVKTTQKCASITIKDCTRLDSGHYDLVLTNSGGTKTVPITVRVLDRPGPPTGPLRVIGIMSDKCDLFWTEPSQDGGANISHYIVEKRETSRLSWTLVDANIQATSYKVTKLLRGDEYIFRVMAVNKYGISDTLESEAIIARNPFTPPSKPSTPEASDITKDSMVLSWNVPDSDGGTEIIGYHLEKRDKDGVRWTKCNRQKLTDLHFKVTGLSEGHFYEFRVSAENEAGVGELSDLSLFYRAINATTPPGPPHHPKVTDYTSSSVSLAWGKPAHDGGAYVKGYIVEMKEVSAEEWTICTPPTGLQATRLTVEKLKENAEYNFRVCAINSEGVGEPAEVHGSVIATEKIETPEIELDADLRKVVSAGDDLTIERACSMSTVCMLKTLLVLERSARSVRL